MFTKIILYWCRLRGHKRLCFTKTVVCYCTDECRATYSAPAAIVCERCWESLERF